jgi:hypothetical protein
MRSIPFETRLLATWCKQARHCSRIEMVYSGLRQFILTCNCHLRCQRGAAVASEHLKRVENDQKTKRKRYSGN